MPDDRPAPAPDAAADDRRLERRRKREARLREGKPGGKPGGGKAREDRNREGRPPLSPEQEARRERAREVARLARRLVRTGMQREPSRAIARHVLGHLPRGKRAEAEPLPPVAELSSSLSVAGMFMLLNMSHKEPRVTPLLDALLDRMIETARTVHDWPSLRAGLRSLFAEVGPNFDAMAAQLAEHPDAVARGAGEATLEGWADATRLGAVLKLLADTMEPDGRFMERLDQFAEQTLELRHIPREDIAACADPKGTLFVSIHNPHLAHLRQCAMDFFPDHHFINAPALRSSSPNAMLLGLVRTLRRGGIGMMVPDGVFGRVDRELEIFGQPLAISDSFARIAWRTGCRLLLVFALSDSDALGLRLDAIDLPRPTGEADEEAYVESVLAAFAEAVAEGMVRHPFDVGISHRIGKRLAEAQDAEAAGGPAAAAAPDVIA